MAFRGFTGFGKATPVNQPAAQPKKFGFSPGAMGGRTPKKASVNAPTKADLDYQVGKIMYSDFLKRNKPQAGGISSINPQSRVATYMQQDPNSLANVRAKYFDNRFIPTDRAKRRLMQDQLVDQFKAQFTKPVQGSSNLLQMTADAPQSLADYRSEVAFNLGPIPSELMGDAGYAIGSMAKGLAEKGTPLMNLMKSIYGGVQNFFAPKIEGAMGAVDNFMQSGQNFNTLLMGLPPYQRRVYDMEIMKPGMTREEAFRTAIRTQQMAMGGVANL